MAFKVLASDKVSEDGLNYIREQSGFELTFKTGLSEDELCEIIGEFDGLLIRSNTKVTPKVLAAATNLKAVGRAGIGVDNVDLAEASKRGVVVMNTPFGNTVTTAEHALSLLLSVARNIPQGTATTKAGQWAKSKLKGRELWKKTLGIVGLGNIGKIVADRARGLHMRVIASDPVVKPDLAAELGVDLVSFDELLAQSDFITIHAPAIPATRHIFNDAAFAKMKKSALLVNAARGGIVDEDALVRAIEGGVIAGAAVDVFEKEPVDPNHPLLKLDKVIVTPHLGASTHEAQNRVGVQVAEQMVAFLRDGTVTNGVNVTSVSGDLASRLQDESEVARRLGRLLGQLCKDAREIRVTATGPLADMAKPLTAEVVAAFLEVQTGKKGNALSAPFEAKERDIKVVDVAEPNKKVPTLRVVVNGDEIHTATGRRSRGGGLRLVGLEGYAMDAVLKGPALIVANDDKPGVIGAVGTILGKHGINVARLQVGLDDETGRALAVWNLAGEVPPNVADELRAQEHIRSVASVVV